MLWDMQKRKKPLSGRETMENRRQRYNLGSPIKNQNFVIDVKFDITELDLMCAYIISENRNICTH